MSAQSSEADTRARASARRTRATRANIFGGTPTCSANARARCWRVTPSAGASAAIDRLPPARRMARTAASTVSSSGRARRQPLHEQPPSNACPNRRRLVRRRGVSTRRPIGPQIGDVDAQIGELVLPARQGKATHAPARTSRPRTRAHGRLQRPAREVASSCRPRVSRSAARRSGWFLP